MAQTDYAGSIPVIRSTQSLEKKKGVLNGTPFAYLPCDCFYDWVCWTCRDSDVTVATGGNRNTTERVWHKRKVTR